MRRALRYAAIWCGATVVAVSVSWFGVRDVLREEFVDDVDVEPFLAQTIAAGERAGTRAPAAPTAPAPTAPAPTSPAPTSVEQAPATPAPRSTPKEQRTTAPATKGPGIAAPTPSLKVVKVKGGEVAFTIGREGCRLISATPVSGYTAKIARADGWIRVDLVKGEHGTGVFCIGHERRTDTWEY
ncbi:hypothetical protein [Nonomuraea sp. NPDC050202]|uniref:hypothetical protein n=1 Tax=Nonomuraea sp. NPDC050202 TaxID=3155035 RepID=UPI0034002D21